MHQVSCHWSPDSTGAAMRSLKVAGDCTASNFNPRCPQKDAPRVWYTSGMFLMWNSHADLVNLVQEGKRMIISYINPTQKNPLHSQGTPNPPINIPQVIFWGYSVIDETKVLARSHARRYRGTHQVSWSINSSYCLWKIFWTCCPCFPWGIDRDSVDNVFNIYSYLCKASESSTWQWDFYGTSFIHELAPVRNLPNSL